MPRPEDHPHDRFPADKFPPPNFPLDKIPAHAQAKIPFLNIDPGPQGSIDILATEFADESLSVLLNDGAGSYSLNQDLAFSDFAGMALGDLDGDGDLDLVLGTQVRSQLNREVSFRVLLNDGSGEFSEFDVVDVEFDNPLNSGFSQFDIGLGDIDGDSDLDVVAIGGPQRIVVMLNDGSATFSQGPTSNAPALGDGAFGQGPIAFADIDDDGDVDVAVGSDENTSVIIYKNDGAGNLTEVDSIGLQGEFVNNVIFADIDGDGDFDVLSEGAEDSAAVTIGLNDGTGEFTENQIVPPMGFDSESIIGLAVGDIDDDGDLDIAFTLGDANDVLIFKNEIVGGIPSFSLAQTISLTDTDFVHFADIDGDGDLDALVSGNIAPDEGIFVLSNDGSGNFSQTDFLALDNPFDFLLGNLDEPVPPNSVPDPADLMII